MTTNWDSRSRWSPVPLFLIFFFRPFRLSKSRDGAIGSPFYKVGLRAAVSWGLHVLLGSLSPNLPSASVSVCVCVCVFSDGVSRSQCDCRFPVGALAGASLSVAAHPAPFEP